MHIDTLSETIGRFIAMIFVCFPVIIVYHIPRFIAECKRMGNNG
jgi:hypothetical protein